MVYNMLKTKITQGTYDKDDVLKKMDVYLMFNRITSEQYEELAKLMEAAE